MINFKLLSRIMSFLLACIAAFMLVACSVSWLYHEIDTAVKPLLYTIGITLGVAGLFYILGWKANGNFSKRDSFVMVSVSWVIVSCLGMLPFMISGDIPTVHDAFFETISGFTTTGATILDDIESLPKGLLFWRAMTQWIGGLGIVFFTIAVLPIFGVGGVRLVAAETSGPTKEKIHPRIGVTAQRVWAIYLGLTITEIILLMVGRMDAYDAVCHSFTTISTGGFSPRQASIAYYSTANGYHEQFIQYVMSFFMLISGVNFNLLYIGFSGKITRMWRDSEIRWYTWSVIIFVTLIAVFLFYQEGMGGEESFRTSLFQVASLHTSTGYATANYCNWPTITWGCLTLIMLMGACAGSTTGGLKSIRMTIMARIARSEFVKMLHPRAVIPVRVNHQVVSPDVKSRILAFAFVYMALVVCCSLVMMGFGIGFIESLGCVISALGNMGPALGEYNPDVTWFSLPAACKWMLSILMLLGRLELFTVLILFTRSFWKEQ